MLARVELDLARRVDGVGAILMMFYLLLGRSSGRLLCSMLIVSVMDDRPSRLIESELDRCDWDVLKLDKT